MKTPEGTQGDPILFREIRDQAHGWELWRFRGQGRPSKSGLIRFCKLISVQ